MRSWSRRSASNASKTRFNNWKISPMKPIMLIGECWGEYEHRIRSAFCGPSGIELLRMLHEAKVITLTPADRDYINQFYQRGDPRAVDSVWRLHPEVHRS